jgi:zinc/manganese transport system permease protein
MVGGAIAIAVASGLAGLLLSFHANLPAGPAIILVAGAFCLGSILLGRVGGYASRLIPRTHLEG